MVRLSCQEWGGAVAGEGDYGRHFQEAGLWTGDMALKAVRDPRSFWLR